MSSGPRSKRQRTGNGSTKTPVVATIKEEEKSAGQVEDCNTSLPAPPPENSISKKEEAIDDIGDISNLCVIITSYLYVVIESYPDYIKRKKVLLANRDRRVAEADRNRRSQVKNITDLYEFELEDIEAKLQVRITHILFLP